MPAQCTIPSSFGSSLTNKANVSASVKSPDLIMTLSGSINDSVSLSLVTLRPLIITVAPILEHVTAMPRPIPDEAPVTRTNLPSNEKGL